MSRRENVTQHGLVHRTGAVTDVTWHRKVTLLSDVDT